MNATIALINTSIQLKSNNGKNGYNFYEWLRQAKKDFRPDLSLKEIYLQITFAACTEKSCFDTIPV
jgi:hypothetical protein